MIEVGVAERVTVGAGETLETVTATADEVV